MRSLFFLALKDLQLLVRDRLASVWTLGIPLLFALFFGTLFGSGGRGGGGMRVAVVDEDDSPASRALVARLEKSPSLRVSRPTADAAREAVRHGDLTGFIVIPKGYGDRDGFFGGDPAVVQVGIDPSRRAEEGFLQGILTEAAYAGLQERFADPKAMRAQVEKSLRELEGANGMNPVQRGIVRQFLGSLEQFLGKVEPGALREGGPGFQPVKVESVPVLRNEAIQPRSAYEVTFASSVLWGIIGGVTHFAVSIVGERRGGTLLRLRVSPLTRLQILAGKALACFAACIAIAVVVLAVGRLVFGVRLEQPVHLALAIVCTAFCFTGIMMLLSTIGTTEASVSGGTMGILLPLAMLGGGTVPLFIMPGWMQSLSNVSPVKWGILALEGAIWRGFSLAEMVLPCAILIAVGGVTFAAGVWLLARQDV